MATTDATGVMTGKPLIESDRVEGTVVYDRAGNRIGSIKRLMIDKKTGQVAYTVLSFGGFLGLGSEEHTIPWNKLDYDTGLGGFRTKASGEDRGWSRRDRGDATQPRSGRPERLSSSRAGDHRGREPDGR